MSGEVICALITNDDYFYVFIVGTAGWGLCCMVLLALSITYWVIYKKRVAAEAELLEYKFTEQREILRMPPELNTKSTFTPMEAPSNSVFQHSGNLDPQGTNREDAFLTSPNVTYRPPTNVANDSQQRWLPIK